MSEHISKLPSAKQLKNEQALIIYAAFLTGLTFLSVAVHQCHSFRDSRQVKGRSFGNWAVLLRKLNRRTRWTWLSQPSFGLILLVAVFTVGNIALCTTILASRRINHYASRCGWLGAANMALCVFLSMKNTPLSFLAATSHAELNVLHRIVGYAAGILVLLHAVLYTIHFGIQDRWETLIEPGNIEGIGSGVAMIVLLLGTFRSRNYSLFYLSHIIGFVAALVLTGLHRPDWAKKLPVVVLCIASIWAADRSIRAARSSYNAINNQVTLYPLPDGGTRLLVKKPSNGSVLPGTHCYIWIPRLRLFHAHPFTVVSSSPYGLEFVAKSYKRFTKDLSGLATNHPGICISRVFLDGPYGSMPDNSGYDKVVLIAGGSGGAFTFGLINRILNHSSRISLQAIDFVWAVKRTEHLFWFHEHLNDIMAAAAGINVQVYVTEGSPPNAQRVSAVEHDICTTEDTQNDLGVVVPRIKSGIHETLQSCNVDDLLSGAAYCEKVRWQKMDVEVVIREAVEATEGRQRVLIATCGPTPLTNAVKDTAQSLGDQTGYKVDVHAENFSS